MRESWDALGSVLDGTASPETRARLAAELDDPNSAIALLLSEGEAAGVALYGPMLPIIRVSMRGYIARYVLFLAFWGAFLAVIFWLWPMSTRTLVLSLLSIAGIVGFVLREFWLGLKELSYAGIRTRGTLFEALKGSLIGIWFIGVISQLGLYDWADPQGIRNTMLLAVLIWTVPASLAGMLRGMGFREQLAGSSLNIRQRLRHGSLHWMLMFPWVWFGAWCLILGVTQIMTAASIDFGAALPTYGTWILATLTCGVLATQTGLKPSGDICGGWMTALAGSFYLAMVASYTVVPLVALTAWLLGGSILFWLSVVLIGVGYIGFVSGAAVGVAMTGEHLVREHLRVGIALLAASGATTLAVSGVFGISPWIGISLEFSRLFALVSGFAAFFTVLMKADQAIRRTLKLPIIESVLESPVQQQRVVRSFAIRDVFLGPSLILMDLQTSLRSVRGQYLNAGSLDRAT